MNILNIIINILHLTDILSAIEKNNYKKSDISLNEYKFGNPESDTDIYAGRMGNSIYLSGKLNNKKYGKTYKIDEFPWYQDWPSGIKNEIYFNKEKFFFWSIDPQTFKIARFKGRVLKRKSKKQGNDPVNVKISLSGIQKIFWKGIIFQL